MLPFIAQRYYTVCSEATLELGVQLGRRARAGDCIACSGALGAGKTTLVKGIARGLGIPETEYVRSPTFALVHEYHGDIPLFHFDFYRLSSLSEVQDIGFEEYLEARGVVVTEWADKFSPLLPPKHLEISIHLLSTEARSIVCLARDRSYARYFLPQVRGHLQE